MIVAKYIVQSHECNTNKIALPGCLWHWRIQWLCDACWRKFLHV